MVWKVERWLTDVFPGQGNIVSEYRDLPRRELAIVAAGVLDVGLAEILSLRFQNFPAEYESFLGLNEDGRAPCASFGARIQLALLLGILTESDASVLRLVKNIRNRFAHRINVDFTDDRVKPLVIRLHDKMREVGNNLAAKGVLTGPPAKVDEIRPYFEITPEAGAGLLLSVFAIYQAYFHRLHGLVTRVDSVRTGSDSDINPPLLPR